FESRGHSAATYCPACWRQVKGGGRDFGIRGRFMNFASRLAAVTVAALMCWSAPASAQQAPPPPPAQNLPPPQRAPGPNVYGPDELVNSGHRFFGNVSRGLASIIERAGS